MTIEKLTLYRNIMYGIVLVLGILIVVSQYYISTWTNQLNRLQRNEQTDSLKSNMQNVGEKITQTITDKYQDHSSELGKLSDTLMGKISRSNDEIKQTIHDQRSPDPQIIIRSNGVKHIITNEKVLIRIHLNAVQAPSDITFDGYYLQVNYENGARELLRKFNPAKKNVVLPIGEPFFFELFFETSEKMKEIYVIITGKYSTLDKSRVYKLEETYKYILSSGMTGYLTDDEKATVISRIKNNDFNN